MLYIAATVLAIVTAQVARGTLASLQPRSLARVLLGMQIVRVGARGLFALAPNLALALVPWFAGSVFNASFGPLYRAWLIGRTDPDVRATVLSTTSVANAFGQVTGGPATGAIGEAFGLRPALLSSALFLVPAALFFARATGRGEGRATTEVAPMPS